MRENRNNKPKAESYRDSASFIKFPEMKASFFAIENKKSNGIVVRLDEGVYKGVIVELKDFTFPEEDSSTLTFNRSVIFTPEGVNTNTKSFDDEIKKITKYIIEYAIRGVASLEKQLTNIKK